MKTAEEKMAETKASKEIFQERKIFCGKVYSLLIRELTELKKSLKQTMENHELRFDLKLMMGIILDDINLLFSKKEIEDLIVDLKAINFNQDYGINFIIRTFEQMEEDVEMIEKMKKDGNIDYYRLTNNLESIIQAINYLEMHVIS
jgi:hypothetical protein